MRVLVTGGLGVIGSLVTKNLLANGHTVRIFDHHTRRSARHARRLLHRYRRSTDTPISIQWGDIRIFDQVLQAMSDIEAVIHLAAIIPPLADEQPQFAYEVNVIGTEQVIRAMKQAAPHARLIFSSSIAVYGDRVHAPYITLDDAPHPNTIDPYAHQKLEAEAAIHASGLDWTIFRLSYIVSPENLRLHPIMFDMPLDTSLEICTAADTGVALAHAIEVDGLTGLTLPIAGGVNCRTTYREFLQEMLGIFGLGRRGLPEQAFSTGAFHCGFMDTRESQARLHYQHMGLQDLLRQLSRIFRVRRFFVTLFRPLARWIIIRKSHYLRKRRLI